MRVGTYNVLGICGFPKEAGAAALGGPDSPERSESATAFATLRSA